MCFDPEGNLLSDTYSCGFPDQSTCCGYGWDCLSNGLCRGNGTTGYSYAQGTCADPTYENCLSFCNQEQFDSSGKVRRCESNGNSWCCEGAPGPDCCDTNRTTSLEPYPFAVITNIGISNPLRSSSLDTTLQSTIYLSTPTSTQALATPSQTSASPQSTDQSNSSKTGIEIGIPVAIVVVLLAVITFFVFQNRRFKHRLIQLHSQTEEGPLGLEETRPKTQEVEGHPIAELDLTRSELTQQDAPEHELLGNGIHELNHNDFPLHELDGDRPRS